MPRARLTKNKGFPTGWRRRGNSIYYMVPRGLEHHWDGKREFKLGGNVAEAYRTWAERIPDLERGSLRFVSDLIEQYIAEHVPTLSPKTQESYLLALRRIGESFGHVLIRDVTQAHARQFYTGLKRKYSIATARSTAGNLKHLMTMAAEWGAIPTNPLLGMRFPGAKPATRLLTRGEISRILSLEPQNRTEQIGIAFVRLALLTGLRRADILGLRLSDCQADNGITVVPRKTAGTSGVSATFKWTEELRESVRLAEQIPPRRIGDAPLFVTRTGQSFLGVDGKASGFDSLSRRFTARTLELGLVDDKWTMKDLRAAVASHAPSLDEAQKRLMHSSPTVTDKHYRRAAPVLEPVSLDNYCGL